MFKHKHIGTTLYTVQVCEYFNEFRYQNLIITLFSVHPNNFHNPFKVCALFVELRDCPTRMGCSLVNVLKLSGFDLPVRYETGEETSKSHAHQKHHLGKVFQLFSLAN